MGYYGVDDSKSIHVLDDVTALSIAICRVVSVIVARRAVLDREIANVDIIEAARLE